MAKKKETNEERKIAAVGKPLRQLNRIANSLATLARGGGATEERHREVDNILDEVNNIISDDFSSLKDISRRKSSDVYDLLTGNTRGGMSSTTIDPSVEKSMDLKDLFEGEDNSLLNEFKERHKNRAVYLQDIHTVTSQVHELGEAILTTRDATISADTITDTISRTLTTVDNGTDSNLMNSADSALLQKAESVELEYDLPHRLKDHIIPNTLKYGTYYVYVIPYRNLFQEMELRKQENYRRISNRGRLGQKLKNVGSMAMESLMSTVVDNNVTEGSTVESVLENNILNDIPTVKKSGAHDYVKEELLNTTNEILESISVGTEHIPLNLIMENVSSSEVKAIMKHKNNKRKVNTTKVFPSSRKERLDERNLQTGTSSVSNGNLYDTLKGLQNREHTSAVTSSSIDVNTKINNNTTADNYSDITGAYVKLLDPRKIIPIAVMEETIGYFYIHSERSSVPRASFSGGFVMDMTNPQTLNTENEFMGKIAEQIAIQTDLKFIKDNTQFKETIANALIFNDVYRRNLHFQFVPAEYIQEFRVNESEDGVGQSMIKDALFYGKLYLAVLLFKIVTVISRSNDQRLIYVRTSGLDTNTSNRVQRVARELKRREMSFTDLMSYSSISTKVGQGLDMYIPTGTNDQRGLDFELLPGQDVDLHTPLLDRLHTAAINSTGTPAPILEHVNSVDYSRSLVMANIKFLNRVISYQSSFNRDISSLISKILIAEGVNEDEANSIRYSLSRPSSLSVTNLVELSSNADSAASTIVEHIVGRNGEQTEEDNAVKDIVSRKIMEKVIPNFNEYVALVDDARVEYAHNNQLAKEKELRSGGQDQSDNQDY